MALKYQTREASLADAANEAYGDLQGLGEEMREWADNLEEKFSNTDKYQRVSEAADTLEGLNEPDYPDWANATKVQITELIKKPKRPSRASRRDDACSILQVCMEACQEWLDEHTEVKEGAELELSGTIEQLQNDLESLKDEAEAVEFPGMYG